jgi:hypothetical protein
MLKLVCRELPPKGILETTKYEGGGGKMHTKNIGSPKEILCVFVNVSKSEKHNRSNVIHVDKKKKRPSDNEVFEGNAQRTHARACRDICVLLLSHSSNDIIDLALPARALTVHHGRIRHVLLSGD